MNSEQRQLFQKINEVSFALDDIVLFLDTHPQNREALEYYRRVRDARKALVKEYAQKYGPLTKEQVMVDGCSCREGEDYFTWVNAPWPWEGGNC